MIRETTSLEDMYKNRHNAKFYVKKGSSLSDYVENNLNNYINLPEYKDLIDNHGWTDDDVYFDVLSKLKHKNQRIIAAHFKHMLALTEVPTDPVWGQYSYQEIIDMADQGAHVPEKILQWAKAMANDDIVSYDMSDIGSDNDILNNIDADMVDYRSAETKYQIKRYSQIADKQKKEAEEKVTKTENVNIEMEKQKENLEYKQRTTTDKLEMYKIELDNLQGKINAGEKLTSDEQIKYRAISGKIEEENHNIVLFTNQVDREIEDLFDSINDIYEDTDIYNKLSEQLDIRAGNFAVTEAKLNNGTLHSTIYNVGLFSNPYQSSALACDLSHDLQDISKNLYLQTSLLHNNLFAASNIRFDITKDVENINNQKLTSNIDNEINYNIENSEYMQKDENNKINANTNTENEQISSTDDEQELNENKLLPNDITEENIDADYTQSQIFNPDTNNNEINHNSKDLPIENSVDFDTLIAGNGEITNNKTRSRTPINVDLKEQKSEAVLTSAATNNKNKINLDNTNIKTPTNYTEQTKSLEHEDNTISDEKENLFEMADTKNEMYVSEATDTAMIDNAELSTLKSQSEELAKSIENNKDNIENLSGNNLYKTQPINDNERINIAETFEQKTAERNIVPNKIISENIFDITQKLAIVENILSVLVGNTITEPTDMTTNYIDNSKRKGSSLGYNTVILAHENLIDNREAIKDFINNARIENSKLDTKTNSEDKKTNNTTIQNINTKNTLTNIQKAEPDTAENNQVQSDEKHNNKNEDKFRNKYFNQKENNTGDNNFISDETSQDITKKDSPRNESMSVRQAVNLSTSINDSDIKTETVKNENIHNGNSGLKELNKEIIEKINSSKPEYMNSQIIVGKEEAQSEKYISDINAEQTKAISTDTAKESIRAEVRNSVYELMQSVLSETNKNEQKKDSDNDKRHKLFTQFEREKKDALRKTVQKINRARDAR